MTSPSINPAIEFRDVSYGLPGAQPILSGLNLQVDRGSVLVLLGRSGSGKSTALKLINGLLIPGKGQVLVEGRATIEWDLIQLRRSIGYAIQEVGLLPHFTVEKNIGLVPQLQQWPRERIQQRVNELMSLLQLPTDFRRRFPHQLSGGQRQRVGLARALAADPPILLMDEPFGALDPLTRADIQREFKALHQRLGKTVVFVTHDVREALFLGSRIALLDGGCLKGIYSLEEFLRATEPLAAEYVRVYRGDEQIQHRDSETQRN
jgi:osmoprotectant transport system ATP-binding protein